MILMVLYRFLYEYTQMNHIKFVKSIFGLHDTNFKTINYIYLYIYIYIYIGSTYADKKYTVSCFG